MDVLEENISDYIYDGGGVEVLQLDYGPSQAGKGFL